MPPMAVGQTRVPEVPDQTDFVDKWHQYHQGYRIVKAESDGSECREDMLCEIPWKDVSPGHLPVINGVERVLALPAPRPISHTVPYVSLEATLDDMIEAATAEQETTTRSHRSNNNNVSRHQIPSISIPREIVDQLSDANEQLAEIQRRRHHVSEYLQRLENELRACEARQSQAARDQRTSQNMNRVFGTREEIARQGAAYVSPLTNMFTRAYERYGVAEEVRAEAVRAEEGRAEAVRAEEGRAEEVRAEEFHAVEVHTEEVRAEESASTQNSVRLQQVLADLARRNHSPDITIPIYEDRVHGNVQTRRPLTLDDENDNRPAPQSEEDMTIKLVCKICLQQMADIAVLPCGHLVMCSFCAAIWVPPRPEDHTQPIRKTSCPLCRKQVKKRVRIFTA